MEKLIKQHLDVIHEQIEELEKKDKKPSFVLVSFDIYKQFEQYKYNNLNTSLPEISESIVIYGKPVRYVSELDDNTIIVMSSTGDVMYE